MCTTGYVKIAEGARESFDEANMLLNIFLSNKMMNNKNQQQ